jgi:hypothetical protein
MRSTATGALATAARWRSAIRGPLLSLPGGQRVRGDYDRHAFSYVVPAGVADAGSQVFMLLVNEDTLHLWRDEASARRRAAPAEVWRRCPGQMS